MRRRRRRRSRYETLKASCVVKAWSGLFCNRKYRFIAAKTGSRTVPAKTDFAIMYKTASRLCSCHSIIVIVNIVCLQLQIVFALTAANVHFAATNVCSYNSGSDGSQTHHAAYNNMEPYTGTSCRLQQYGTIHWNIMPSTCMEPHTNGIVPVEKFLWQR